MCAQFFCLEKMPYVRRYSRFRRKSYSYPRSRSYAARKIQSSFRKRRRTFARRVTRVIQNQEPVKYSINDPSSNNDPWVLHPYGIDPGTGQPSTSAQCAIETIGIIPYSATSAAVGSRQSRKVYLQNLSMTWNISNGRVYAAGAAPQIIRLAVLEARACDIRSNEVLLNLANTTLPPTGNSVTHPFNHKKVKVLWTKNVTIGDLNGGYEGTGYKDVLNFKTFHKLNRQSIYQNNDPALVTDMPLKRNLYLWACCPTSYVALDIRITVATTLSFKSMD